MRVVVLHNAVSDDAPLEDQDTLIQVDVVRAALIRLGHQPATVSCTLNLAALHDELRRLRPDVVFNLVESLAEADSLSYLPLAVLDVLGLPYTGSRTESLFLTTHKLLAKQRLQSAGLPTPAWMESGNPRIPLDFRNRHPERSEGSGVNSDEILRCAQDDKRGNTDSSWIIKGVWDQGSRGMEDDAVLVGVDSAEVRKRLAGRAARSAGPCFAEQFVEGREFNLSVLAGEKRGQAPFVQSTRRAVPAKGACPLFRQRDRRSSRRPRSTSPLSRPTNRGSWAIGPSGRPIRSSINTHPAGSTSPRPTGRCWTNSVTWPSSVGRCLGCGAGCGSIFGWMPPEGRGFWRSTPTRVSRPMPVLRRR